jgi:hypothetical protein
MKENIEKITKQMAEDDVLRNNVSRQAQEAILNPEVPDAQKDEVLEAAVETIHRIGQNRNTYNAIIDAHDAKRDAENAKHRERRRLKRTQTIYEAK